jgi:hypothetical protein
VFGVTRYFVRHAPDADILRLTDALDAKAPQPWWRLSPDFNPDILPKPGEVLYVYAELSTKLRASLPEPQDEDECAEPTPTQWRALLTDMLVSQDGIMVELTRGLKMPLNTR